MIQNELKIFNAFRLLIFKYSYCTCMDGRGNGNRHSFDLATKTCKVTTW